MRTGAVMIDPGLLEAAINKWINPDRAHEARQEIVFAFQEFEATAPTLRDRELDAADKLAAIADAAKKLCLALDTMPERAKYALLDHRNATRQPGTIHRWLDDLHAVREGVLGPLAEDAAAALKHLPAGPGKGRPAKAGPSPRDALLLRLAALYADCGREREGRGEPPLHEFLHDAVETVGMKLPDDLARVLRVAEGKSAEI